METLYLESTPLTERKLDEFVRDSMGEGDRALTLFATAELCTELDLLVGSRMRAVASNLTYGAPVKQLVTAHGDLNVIKMAGTGRIGFIARIDGVIRGL